MKNLTVYMKEAKEKFCLTEIGQAVEEVAA